MNSAAVHRVGAGAGVVADGDIAHTLGYLLEDDPRSHGKSDASAWHHHGDGALHRHDHEAHAHTHDHGPR